MKVVILAGGLGTRISEETHSKPKPMVEIGGKPILWHIMKMYEHYGLSEFVICLGYKGYVIKEYFANYILHNADVTLDIAKGEIQILNDVTEKWKVSLIDTGIMTPTGSRLSRVRDLIGNERFCMTYGDGVANVNIEKLIDYHHDTGKFATLTAVSPPGRFGAVTVEGNDVTSFCEKPVGDGGMINGGFFVLEPGVFDYVTDDNCIWEQQALPNLANDKQLSAYHHQDFWRPVDTLRDQNFLEECWQKGESPWKIWQ